MTKSKITAKSTKQMKTRHHNNNIASATTGFARRALLLLTFLVASVGSVWGQTFNTDPDKNMVAGAIVEDKYLDVLNKYDASCNIGVDEVVKALNSLGSNWTEDDIADNVYLRWSILDGNGNIASNYVRGTVYDNNSIGLNCAASTYNWDNRNQWLSSIAGFYWFQDRDIYNVYELGSILNVSTNVNQYGNTFSVFSDYTIVCYITDNFEGITRAVVRGEWDKVDGELNYEPDFKVKFVFHFGPKIDNFVGSLKPDPDGKSYSNSELIPDIANTTSMPINLSNAFAMVENPTYVRIYLEKGGEAVDPTGKLTGLEELNCPTPEHGYYIYNSTGLQTIDLPEITLTLPANEFEDYNVITVWSIGEAEFDTDGKITKEPDWDLQYTFAFEYPFKGDVTHAIQMESTLKIPTSKKTEALTLSFDYERQLIKLTSNNTEIATAPIDPKFLNAYSNATTQLTNNFYIRWFLQKSGVETYISGSLSDATNGTYQTPAKERYYYYWDANNDNTNRALNDVLKINLNGSILSPLTDYDLIFTIATEREGIIYDGENKLTHEPDEMAYQYAFHFEDKPFEAENLSTVKTIYKTALYDKSTGQITPDLFYNYYNELMGELGSASSNFGSAGYVRWYVTDTEGKIIEDIDDWKFEPENEWIAYKKINSYGYYMERGVGNKDSYYNPTFTFPNSYNKETDYKNYQIVCVIATNREGISMPDNEPTTMQVKYVFSQILTEEEMREMHFIHYKGLSGRDFILGSGAGNVTQQYWNEKIGKIEETTEDIRQGVHTWEYDIYAVPGDTRPLVLPFQFYTVEGTNDAEGQDNEPQSYVRWYDWNTDKTVVSDGTFEFKGVGTFLEDIENRGLFNIYQGYDDDLWQGNVGVTFKSEENFSDAIDIACDVSKYTDGMFELEAGKKYSLLHEPTLSTRYIFHIHPASAIADSLDAAKHRLENAGNNAEALYKAMSTLKEDKGLVVVSIKDNDTRFSLRLDLQDLSDYIINGNGFKRAGKLVWYAYYETNEGIQRSPSPLKEEEPIRFKGISNRISDFKYDTFKKLYDGDNFHVVGFVKEDDNSANEYPVAHYELRFIDAPAIPLDNIIAGNVDDQYLNRTELYMKANNYVQVAILDFDGNPETNPNVIGKEAQYYSTQKWYDAPTSSADNMTYEPFPWEDIQYGFCYPPLTETIRDGYRDVGAAPDHSDYIVLKSMNWEENKISGSKFFGKEAQPYEYIWWESSELHDYTYYATDGEKHGSFLYTDASEESRSIATIPFTATDLCAGSSIYFTAVVANKTASQGIDSHTPPQLLIRIVGIKDDGTRERIVAFHTGELNEASAGVIRGPWYQVYGTTTLSKEFDKSITEFEAEVINYANGTYGADFAFDQFVIYTTSAKVLLTQTPSSSCGDQSIADNKVQIYMEAEGLQNAFDDPERPQLEGLQPIYWRIYEKGESGANDKLVTGVGMYPQYNSDGTLKNADTDSEKRNTYGITWVKLDFSDDDLGQIDDDHPFGWYKDDEGNYFFQLADKSFSALERGKNYYVSVYEPCSEEDFDENMEGNWGRKEIKCSIYSDFFIPRRQYVAYIVDAETGKEGGELTIECGSEGVEVKGVRMVLKVPDPNDKITGFMDYPMTFDYAFCSMENWDNSTVKLEGAEYTYNDLAQAWRDYRDKCSGYGKDKETFNKIDPSYNPENSKYRSVLEYAIEKGILILANSTEFEYTFTKNETNQYHVLCLPVEDNVTVNGDTKAVCDAFEVIFKVKSSGGPSLTLGFEEVTTYPEGNRVVRVGKKQLENMQKENGFLLHIPVNTYKTEPDAVAKTGVLEIVGDLDLLKADGSQTDDEAVTNNVKVATFEGEKVISKDGDKMYISVKFHGERDVVKQDFKEGFTYHLFFQVRKQGAGDGACDGPVNFLMKVVPEYVTWNDKATDMTQGAVTPNTNVNTNWNNDKNWSRSKKAELYSDTYTDNTGETPAAFVPMKFTYVTIPSGNVAPNLIGLTRGSDDIYDNIGNDATPNIQYDLMVRMEEKCLDSKHTGYNTDTKIYDCEKFYGNWAKEIYFKPRAELVNQQFLTYGKAWVEKELVANKWYLMSTPLKATYAGDMYVPYSETEGKNGRQETEAFKAIKFTNTDATYSRTAYPIYQRSWGMKDGMVYTQTTDTHRSAYSANLGYTTWSGNIAEWGHTFNDVAVPYTTRSGFSIRAHKKEQTAKALIRLPKDDTSYSYYGYDTEAGKYTEQGDAESSLEKTTNDIGKFVTDGQGENAEVSLTLSNAQQMGDYVLVGNPYMASLDMKKFFGKGDNGNDINPDPNPELTRSYYTYRYDETENKYKIGVYDETEGFGIIRPLESFFVNVNKGTGTATEIKFTSGMMIDGNTYKNTAPSRAFALTVSNDCGQSSATVSVGEEAKSVETLFDSNLSDVPMVYTVANGQAVSINQVTELSRPIAFGVTCTASNEPVTVTFLDIAQLTSGEVYVVDAVTGEQTLVTEGSTLSVQPNDYGRYFLLAGTMGISDKTDVQKGIMVSVRGKVVTVTSGEALTLVRALSPDGTTVHQDAPNGMSQSFTLASGFYVIQAENAAGERQTVKVLIKTE